MNLLRSEPLNSHSIFGVDTIILYFDNRPTEVKITEASEYVSKAIVTGNTVEISITQPIVEDGIRFKVTWADGVKWFRYLTFELMPEDVPANFLRADPPDGSSIAGVDAVTVYLDNVPHDAKYYNWTSEDFGEVIVKGKTIEFTIPHPITEPSISFTVSWSGKSKIGKMVRSSKKLTYTNAGVVPEE